MSILNAIKATKAVRAPQVPMTDAQYSTLRDELFNGDTVNVRANKFNIERPYAVSVKKDGKYHNYGAFTSLDVASAVGTITSRYQFGQNSIVGAYDQAVVEAHPEFKAWLADSRNAKIVKQVSA